MADMPLRPLAELAHITMGQSPDTGRIAADGGGLPFLQGCAEFGAKHPTAVTTCNPPLRTAPEGSALVSVRAPVGAMNIADQTYCIGRGLAAFKAKVGVADTIFLKHAVELGAPWLHRRSQGSTFAAISADDLRRLPVPDFPPEAQARIAAILTSLDTAIEATEALIEKHQQIKAGLMHDLFTRGISRSGQLRPRATDAPELYRSVRDRLIPLDWHEVELQSVADVSRGKFTHRPRNDPRFLGGPHPFIQTGDIAAAAGDYLTAYSQTLSDLGASVSSRFPAGTVAVTIAANIADTAILSAPMFFPDSVVGVVVRPVADVRFIELCIRLSKPKLEAMAPQSAQRNINLQDLRPLKVMLPPLAEQVAISQRYEAALEQIRQLRAQRNKLHAQKQGLMQDLLTGKVRVPVPANAST